MKIRLLTALGIAWGLVGVVPASLALGATPMVNIRVPLAFTTDGECTGEPITFDGTLHLVLRQSETANGSHSRGHANQHFEGVGLVTGSRYIGVFSQTSGSNIGPGASNTTLVSNFHIVRQGESVADDDYSEHIFIHLTLTATGEEQAYFDDFRSDCA